MKSTKPLPRFNGVFISVGLAFLIFPTIILYDVMPDLIGWVLIYIGISELAYFNEDLEALKKLTMYLSCLSAVRIVLGLLMAGSLSSDSTTDTNNFLAMVSFLAVCELICVIVYSGKLFGGMETLVSLNGGTSAIKAVEKARRLGTSFLVVRIILTALPELFTLAQLKAVADIDNELYWIGIYALRRPVMLLCIFAGLVYGIWFFFGMRKMFSKVRHDAPLMQELGRRYVESEGQSVKRMLSRISTALFLFTGAFLFFINFVLDYKYLTPTFIMPVFILACCMLLKKDGDFKKPFIAACVAIPITAVGYFFRLTTADNYYKDITLLRAYIETPLTEKLLLGVLGLASCVALALLITFIYSSLLKMTVSITGKNPRSLFLAPQVAAYMYLFLNTIMFIFPPAREILTEADLVVTIVMIWLNLRLSARINNEITAKYRYE